MVDRRLLHGRRLRHRSAGFAAVLPGTETPSRLRRPPYRASHLGVSYPSLQGTGAVFANATWHISPKFDLSFGARWSDNDQDASQVLDAFVFPAPSSSTKRVRPRARSPGRCRRATSSRTRLRCTCASRPAFGRVARTSWRPVHRPARRRPMTPTSSRTTRSASRLASRWHASLSTSRPTSSTGRIFSCLPGQWRRHQCQRRYSGEPGRRVHGDSHPALGPDAHAQWRLHRCQTHPGHRPARGRPGR